MAILASLPGLNLFSSLPSTPPPNDNTTPSTSHSPLPPIPIPKYPPPLRRSKKSQNFTPNPAFKISHRQTKYYKPVKEGQVISSEGERSVLVGESGVSYLLPGAPFQFQFSYSETPKEKPIAIREPAFLPFAPPTMSRPWTGKGPLKKSKKKIPLFESINSPSPDKKGVKYLEMPGPFPYGKYPKVGKTREEILGEPLKRWEIKMMIKPHLSDNRQVNIGRDGLTHNMLELIHTHWRRSEVCKVKCKGVPTVDMNNVCRVLEEKSGGKIIHRVGGVVYLYRGRNYDSRTRPQYPLMLWKPATPVYPKLIQEAPEGLTREQANELRNKGKNLLPIYKLAKNGVYITLVRDVRQAFEGSPLVKIDCKGMHASDYKKIGAKLKELVPCVLLSFDGEQILMWRGKDWKSMYSGIPLFSVATEADTDADSDISGKPDADCSESMKAVSSSPKMMSLWKKAIESSKALLLDEIGLGPDALLKVVEEFDIVSQAAEHSYPALISSRNEDGTTNSMAAFNSNSPTNDYGDDYFDNEDVDDDDDGDEYYDDNSFEDVDSTVPMGSLPVDRIAKKLNKK